MRILAIETSCDDTGMSLVRAEGGLDNPHFVVEKELVSSQVDIHKEFGGVVPMLAKREHIKNLPILYQKIFDNNQDTNNKIQNVDLVAVTVGPGLEPALWTGIKFVEQINADLRGQEKSSVPIVGVNHLHGHMYSFLLKQKRSAKLQTLNSNEIQNSNDPNLVPKDLNLDFPSVVLLVSGGHTMLILMHSLTEYVLLGETVDDAVGESFDKVARMLGLSYPGGPAIQQAAEQGDPSAIHFPSPMIDSVGYDFSYSGLKTAVLYHLRDRYGLTDTSTVQKQGVPGMSDQERANIAAAFQHAAIKVLVTKTMRAVEEFGARSVVIGGGVAANALLRVSLTEAMRERGMGDQLFIPLFQYCMDNATMVAVAGYITYLREISYPLEANGGAGI